MLREFDNALEPVGVGHQADLDEHSLEWDRVQFTRGAVLVDERVDLLVASDLGGLRVGMHRHVFQAPELALQNGVGTQLRVELDQRHVADDAGQVDCRLDAGVAAADHCHMLALEQRTVAMRAIGHALVLELLFARHIDIAPARARRDNDRAALEGSAAFELDLDEVGARHQRGCTLQVHDVDVVLAHMLLQRQRELGPLGFLDRDEILDAHGVEHLATETLRGHTDTDALACCIHRCRRASRTTADDQHIEGRFRRDFSGFPLDATGVELGQDFFQAHATLTELGTVQEHGRYSHDLTILDLVLEGAALDHRGADARVLYRHQV